MATLRQTFSDIASAIRAKGVSGTMKPIEMASKIGQIQNVGYLTFTAEQATTLTLKQNGEIEPLKLLKSNDVVTWTKWENPSTNGISLNAGESVYLKADVDASNKTATGESNYNYFQSTGPIRCTGDIMSIVNISNSNYDFFIACLFKGMGNLTYAPELKSMNQVGRCYSNVFDHCTSLVKPPSVVYVNSCPVCCNGMFYNCKKMTYAPELPSTELSNACYQWMFGACSSLTTAPELPATTLTGYCYQYMFQGCTSLINAPELPAITDFAGYCYNYMFKGCKSLKRIKMNASSGVNWGTNMFDGCTSLELVDMTGSIGVPQLSNVNNFANTNDTYKIVVPDYLYDEWIAATNWASIATHIMKKSDWNVAHPDDILP